MRYLGQCNILRNEYLDGELKWVNMIQQALLIHISIAKSLPRDMLDTDETWDQWLDCHPDASAYMSVWGDDDCIYLQTSGFEFVFIEE